MLLVRGGPGSGKTAWILRNFEELCGSGDRSGDRRIVVPTATLVRHLQHELARDGVVFSPSSVISLSRFAQERVPEIRLIPAGLMQVIVRDALKRLNLAAFAGVADTDGMVATVIETIALFENADCTPDVLASRKPKGGAKAFELLWRAVDEAVAAAGYSSRAGLIRAAARNTEPAVVWMDGFLNLSPLESSLVRSLARHCDLTMAITNSRAAEEIHRLCLSLNAREVLLSGNARKPVREIFEARSPEREVDEIARRILDLSVQGVPFRRVAVALRDPSTYLPLVSAAFERFGIPSRSYFSTALQTHPAAVFLNGLVFGALEGWEFETTLQTLCGKRCRGGVRQDCWLFASRNGFARRFLVV
jgi:ATP-dependent helicase/DNAse subunit B